jgi:hypothetical protein
MFDESPTELIWWGDEGAVYLGPDEAGVVGVKTFIESEPVGGLLDLLLWRLNRRWASLWGR